MTSDEQRCGCNPTVKTTDGLRQIRSIVDQCLGYTKFATNPMISASLGPRTFRWRARRSGTWNFSSTRSRWRWESMVESGSLRLPALVTWAGDPSQKEYEWRFLKVSLSAGFMRSRKKVKILQCRRQATLLGGMRVKESVVVDPKCPSLRTSNR